MSDNKNIFLVLKITVVLKSVLTVVYDFFHDAVSYVVLQVVLNLFLNGSVLSPKGTSLNV